MDIQMIENESDSKSITGLRFQDSNIVSEMTLPLEMKSMKLQKGEGKRIHNFWRPLKDNNKIISKSSKQAGHY